MYFDDIRPEFDFNIPFSIRYPTREWWTSEEAKCISEDSVEIFTDGSVSESGSGYGVYSPTLKVAISESLGKFPTVYQAELAALLCCAYEVKNFNLRNKHIHVFTDNRAVLQSLSNPKIRSLLVKDCKAAFMQLCCENRVTLSWVPGHSGVAGNEIADELAREGAKKLFVGPDPAIGLSLNTGKKIIKLWIHEKFVERWSTIEACRQTKMYLEKPSRCNSRYALSLKKRDLKLLIGVLTGHGQFNRHLNLMDIHGSSTCDHCLEDVDDAKHFVCDCPAFAGIRKKILLSEFLTTERLRKIPWASILRFIKASNRFKDN